MITLFQEHLPPFDDLSIGSSLSAAIEALAPESFGDTVQPTYHSCKDLFSKPRKLQHCLSDSVAESKTEDAVNALMSDKDKARVNPIHGGSGACIH